MNRNKKNKNQRNAIPPAKLREIWDRIPKMIDCKGICHSSCGPVPVTRLERRLVEARTGRELGGKVLTESITCSELLPNGKCGVYSSRPTICRIWGAAAGVPCTHGCKPERELTREESDQIMRDVQALSPGVSHRRQVLDMLERLDPQHREAWEYNNPDWKEKMDKIFSPVSS